MKYGKNKPIKVYFKQVCNDIIEAYNRNFFVEPGDSINSSRFIAILPIINIHNEKI